MSIRESDNLKDSSHPPTQMSISVKSRAPGQICQSGISILLLQLALAISRPS